MGLVVYISTNREFELTKAGLPRWQATFNFFHYLSMMRIKNLSTRIHVGAVCIASLYAMFMINGSHFSQPPSYIHKMTGLDGKIGVNDDVCAQTQICDKQMRTTGLFIKKEKKMDLVSSILYNCLSSYSSWGISVGLTQDLWWKWLLGPWDKLVKTVWEKKIIHEVGIKWPSKLLRRTSFLYKLVQCTCNWSFLCVSFYNRHFA